MDHQELEVVLVVVIEMTAATAQVMEVLVFVLLDILLHITYKYTQNFIVLNI